MAKTISMKILERVATGKVTPGEYVVVKPDFIMSYSGRTYFPPILKESLGATPGLKEVGVEKVLNPDINIVTIDHRCLPFEAGEAESLKLVREAVKVQRIKYFYDGDGIGYQVAVEKGLGYPSKLVLHFDNHVSILGALGTYATSVYTDDLLQVNTIGETWLQVPQNVKILLTGKLQDQLMAFDVWNLILSDIGPDGAMGAVLEFSGSVIDKMSIDGRMTMCALVPFSGAETGIVNPDSKTLDYAIGRVKEPFEVTRSDHDAEYYRLLDYDVSDLEPQVAVPPDVHYIKPISEVEGLEIDQARIVSCVSGRLEDLRFAARILRKKKIHSDVTMIVTPASQEVLAEAAREGLIDVIARSGAKITHSSCDTCTGRMGYMLPGKTCIASATLNTPGRMGSSEAKVYLASPATVAASAIEGKITDPRKFA